MASSQFVSEEDLHAFVDGETDSQTNAVILAYLTTSPVDAARVETWRTQNELIRASFTKIEHEPIPLSLSLAPTRNLRTDTLVPFVSTAASETHKPDDLAPFGPKTGELVKLCAAIGIAFVGGMIAALVTPHMAGSIGDLFQSRKSLMATTATDLPLPSQTLELAAAREKSALAKAAPEKSDDITSKIFPSGATSDPVLLRNLAALDLSVTGFQVGTTPNAPDLCLFLTTKDKDLLTLCLRKADSQESAGYHVIEAGPLRSIDWSEKASHLALAGRLSEMAMLDLAQKVHARIEASDKMR